MKSDKGFALNPVFDEYVAGDGTRYARGTEVGKAEAEKVNGADGEDRPVFVETDGGRPPAEENGGGE